MTKNDILRMGREAGMHDPMIFIGAYERFAKLVAALAAEREREACANLIEAYPEWIGHRAKKEIAAAIRARGNT